MLLSKPFASGDLRGVVYEFENVGDTLPMHKHSRESVHLTFVLKGRIRHHGPLIGEGEYHEGHAIDVPDDIEHEIIGLVPGTKILNIVKYRPQEKSNESNQGQHTSSF